MANRREYSKERFIVYYLCKELSGDDLTHKLVGHVIIETTPQYFTDEGSTKNLEVL